MTISYGVMRTMNYEDTIMYRVMCDCKSPDHETTISIEYDKDINMVSLSFYKDVCWCPYWETKWYNKIWKRITGTLRMLFTGYIELEEEFLIQDDEHIKNIITALIDGRANMQKKIELDKQETNI